MLVKTIEVSDTVRVEIETVKNALRYCIWVQQGDHVYHYFGSAAYNKSAADVEAAALKTVKRIEKNPALLSY